MDNYVIAYIDLLGSKSKILGANRADFLQIIQNLYKNIMSMFNNFDDGEVKVRIFSDNIIFARKISEESENQILNLIQMTCISAAFQLMSILMSQSMVKGGVVFGEFYIDDTMVQPPLWDFRQTPIISTFLLAKHNQRLQLRTLNYTRE